MPYKKILKFLISGATVAGIDLAILFVLVHFHHLSYLPASAIAFVVAVAASFMLQKFWTFENRSAEFMGRQLFQYVGVALMNLGGNTLGMYLLVDMLFVQYVIAQILLMLLFAIMSFLLYRKIFA